MVRLTCSYPCEPGSNPTAGILSNFAPCLIFVIFKKGILSNPGNGTFEMSSEFVISKKGILSNPGGGTFEMSSEFVISEKGIPSNPGDGTFEMNSAQKGPNPLDNLIFHHVMPCHAIHTHIHTHT